MIRFFSVFILMVLAFSGEGLCHRGANQKRPQKTTVID